MRKQHSRRGIKSHLLLRHQPALASSTDNLNKNTNTNSTTLKPTNATTKNQLTANSTTKNTNTTTSKNTNTTTNSTAKPTNGKITNTTIKPPCNTTRNKNSTKNSKDCLPSQPSSSFNFPWLPILLTLIIIGLIVLIIWLIMTIRKRIQTTKKYNQTPQHFIQNPQLSLNQTKNLKTHKVQAFKKYTQKDCVVEEKNQYGGSVYQVAFMNSDHQRFSAVYWNKKVKTDSYFEIEIDTLDSEIEFGFVGREYFGQLDDGIEMKLSRVGVSLNSQGHLQVHGQTKYQYRWSLQYGDVIGMGLTNIQGNKRVWITKNGILLNPPTQDQVQKWLTKEQLSNSHRDAYNTFSQDKQKHNKKQDLDLMKRKIILPNSQEFNYYAVVGSWEVTGNQMGKSKKFTRFNGENGDASSTACTKVRVNVGGKVFRLRDHNLKSGLLADPIEKSEMCNWLPCFG